MAIPRFDAGANGQDVAAALHAEGCAIVERLAPEPLVARVAAELEPWMAETPPGADEFSGFTTRRTGALLARSDAAVELIAHPLVLDAVDQTLWDGKTNFQLHLTQAIALGAGAPPQQLHRDHWCFDFFPFPPEVDLEVATIWALTEFTEASGATRIVPGSHRTTGMPFSAADTEAAIMPAGSVVLYVGGAVHGGGTNTTGDTRTGVNVDYAAAFLRQEENQYLSVPLERARQLPETVQRLMGYQLGAYALGYVDDARDPMDLLRPPAAPSPSSFAVRHQEPAGGG